MKQGVYKSESLNNIIKFIRLNKDIIRVEGRSGEYVEKIDTAPDGGAGRRRTVFEHTLFYTRTATHYYTKATNSAPTVRHEIELQFP